MESSEQPYRFVRACILTKMAEAEWEQKPHCVACGSVIRNERQIYSLDALTRLQQPSASSRDLDVGNQSLPTSGSNDNLTQMSSKIEQLVELLNSIRCWCSNLSRVSIHHILL